MLFWNRILCLYPAFVSVSLHGVTEFFNISFFADNWDNLNSTDFGSCLSGEKEKTTFLKNISTYCLLQFY